MRLPVCYHHIAYQPRYWNWYNSLITFAIPNSCLKLLSQKSKWFALILAQFPLNYPSSLPFRSDRRMELHLSESQSAGIYCLCLIHSPIVAKGGPRKGGGWRSFYKPTQATQVLQSRAVCACKRVVSLLRERERWAQETRSLRWFCCLSSSMRRTAPAIPESTGI